MTDDDALVVLSMWHEAVDDGLGPVTNNEFEDEELEDESPEFRAPRSPGHTYDDSTTGVPSV